MLLKNNKEKLSDVPTGEKPVQSGIPVKSLNKKTPAKLMRERHLYVSPYRLHQKSEQRGEQGKL